jgi:hypothetical protein
MAGLPPDNEKTSLSLHIVFKSGYDRLNNKAQTCMAALTIRQCLPILNAEQSKSNKESRLEAGSQTQPVG